MTLPDSKRSRSIKRLMVVQEKRQLSGMQLFQEMINIRQPAHTDFCLMLNVNPALALYLSLLSNKIRIYIVYMSHRVRG